jgi:uncharacterized protein (TIGR02145 family)
MTLNVKRIIVKKRRNKMRHFLISNIFITKGITVLLFLGSVIDADSQNINNFNDSIKNSGTFIDTKDNKEYKWVKVGEQIWMAENYAYKADSGCYIYKNRRRTIKKWGYLYTRDAAIKNAPKGWHLPSDEEYRTLMVYITYRDSVEKYNPHTVFDSLKVDRYNLNFVYNGVYYFIDDIYLRGWFPFYSISLWTSELWYSPKQEVRYSKFYHSKFYKSTSCAVEFDGVAMPVRYIKDIDK